LSSKIGFDQPNFAKKSVSPELGQFVADLHLALSRERLESYRPRGGEDVEMLTNYFWNIELAEALMPSLHAAELVLRNSIHAAMTARYGTEMWFFHPDIERIWQRIGIDQLNQRDVVRSRIASRRQVTAGRLVAGFDFGFWVALLGDRYQRPLWQPNKFALYKAVIPHQPRPSRQQVHDRYRAIRVLRNRVFHHEAIWHRPNLLQEHADIHEAIRWISPTLQTAIVAVDAFPIAFGNRAGVQSEIKQRLGLS
jgi:hypothetical protein